MCHKTGQIDIGGLDQARAITRNCLRLRAERRSKSRDRDDRDEQRRQDFHSGFQLTPLDDDFDPARACPYQSSALAIRAPSASDANFAHITETAARSMY